MDLSTIDFSTIPTIPLEDYYNFSPQELESYYGNTILTLSKVLDDDFSLLIENEEGSHTTSGIESNFNLDDPSPTLDIHQYKGLEAVRGLIIYDEFFFNIRNRWRYS